MKYKFLLILIFTASCAVFPQDMNLKQIKRQLEDFNYTRVIELSDQILNSGKDLNDKELIELYTMKGVAHYSLNQEVAARKSFLGILKIDKDHKLNPVEISPKIINFYKDIRKDFLDINKEEEPETTKKKNSPEQTAKIKLKMKGELYQNSVPRSILLPGWGHLYIENNSEGWILSSVSTALLGAMIYFIIDADRKENEYLNETDRLLINEKYDDYNNSYKIRNGLIISYAAVWLYSQIDLLFFSEDIINNKIDASLGFNPAGSNSLNLSLKIKF